MFVINPHENRIIKIKECSFSDLGFKERDHLQEWLENNPDAFGEELLIIQKEFDGFDDTRERLDLLAIDKQGNLVIIELKLDDSGKDVTWQALKYASYCSSLTKPQIKQIYQTYLDKKGIQENSEANISEFLYAEDFQEIQLNQSQRIILVAANYRKEVTSTVLWLLTQYKLNIQCFKVTPYAFNTQLFLNIEQIIPVKEVEEYTIKMAEKAQENQDTQNELKTRHKLRLEFWRIFLQKFNTQSNLFQNINAGKDSWISAGSGLSSVAYNFVVSRTYARTEVYMSRGIAEENKFIFDRLEQQKEKIELEFGEALEWERLSEKKASRIKHELKEVSLYERDDWEKMMEFLAQSMIRLERTFKTPLKKVNQALKKKFRD